MSLFGKPNAQVNPLVVVELATRADVHAQAEARMQRGKGLVIGGCLVSVLGVIAYSIVRLAAGVNQDASLVLFGREVSLVGPALAIIGLGTLVWLIGSVMYLHGATENDPDEPDGTF